VEASDNDRVYYLLSRLKNEAWEKRSARFKCVIALASPDGEISLYHGECHGFITFEPRGKCGFGYDPIFEAEGKTLAEIPLSEKSRISHRARALSAFAEWWRSRWVR
jgi:XTP/dITP diphosphohydrolase